MSPHWRLGAAIVVTVLLAGGCQGRAAEEPAKPVHPQWQRLTLPAPPGEPGRLMLRDITACAGRWYVVGAVATAQGATRPAAWTSTDAQSWSSLAFVPESYYGRQNVLYSAACRDGRLAVIGAKSGGAHGSPRVSTWQQRADGSLVEVAARFELYGGPAAVNVGRMAGGPAGWLIAGNRSSGAAAWVSPDSAAFEIVEAAPELATDGRGVTWAFDAIATPGEWLMVGGVLPAGRIDRDPIAWTSPDGRVWRRLPAPATSEYEELQRVALIGGTAVAVGLRGRAFGAWRRGDGGWEAVGGFGAAGTSGVPAVTGLTVAGDQLLAATSDGTAHALWSSPDGGRSWRSMVAPVAMPAGADRDVNLLALADRVLLLVDDGLGGAVWWTEIRTAS